MRERCYIEIMNKQDVFLFSERLSLKVMRVRDVDADYINGLNDPEVNKFLVNVGLRKQTLKTVREYVGNCLRSGESLLLGIFLRKRNKLVGTINVSGISYFHYMCSVGICIFNKKCWGKGYAIEALKRVVRYIFDDLKLHHIEAGVYKENKTSMSLFKQAGFKQEALFKNRYRHRDVFKEVVMFGRTNSEFDHSVLQWTGR